MKKARSKRVKRKPLSSTEKEDTVSKSGSDWTETELVKFSIFFEMQEYEAMFSEEERANALLSKELKELKATWQSVVVAGKFSKDAISKCKYKLCRGKVVVSTKKDNWN